MKSTTKWALAITASLISSNAFGDGTLCTVNDTSGTPLNVRETAPNGKVIGYYWNGAKVRVLDIQSFASIGQTKAWAQLGDNSGGEVGWVYYPYLSCPPSSLPKTFETAAPILSPLPEGTNPTQPPPVKDSNGRMFEKIFSFPMYDNVYGITILGRLPKDEKTSDDFKKVALTALNDGKLIGSVFLYSPGGNTYEARKIAEQIRVLRAQTWTPFLATDDKTRICQLNPKVTDDGQIIDGSIGRLTYVAETGGGDRRCECASACFWMWSGGVGRNGAVVGVHRFGHWEYKDKFAWFTNEEARKWYNSLDKDDPLWLRGMEVPDIIIQHNITTPFYGMRYLTREEIIQMNNFPPFLQELIYARCGPEPGAQASYVDKVKSRTCRKGILKEEYSLGAKDYLLKYGK